MICINLMPQLSPAAVHAKINVACLRESAADLDMLDNLVASGEADLESISIRANLYRSTLIKNFVREKTMAGYVSPLEDIKEQLAYLLSVETYEHTSDVDVDV